MAIPASSFGIFSYSLGKYAPLQSRLQAAADAGFKNVELFLEDYLHWEKQHMTAKFSAVDKAYKHPNAAVEIYGHPDTASLVNDSPLHLLSARALGDFCASIGLSISNLQPLRNYEGLLDVNRRHTKLAQAAKMFRIMRCLGADTLMLCSSCLPADQLVPSELDLTRHVLDLQMLCDVADCISLEDNPLYRQESISRGYLRIGYEALAWATQVSYWLDSWSIVEGVDRVNFGIVFDSCNVLAKEWADPRTHNCRRITTQYPPSNYTHLISDTLMPETQRYSSSMPADEALHLSCQMLKRIPAEKIFFFQIADLAALETPLSSEHSFFTRPKNALDPSMPDFLVWSRTSRLFPLEYSRGAFLPMVEFCQTIKDTGYDGFWSVEIYNDSLTSDYHQSPTIRSTADNPSVKSFRASIFKSPSLDPLESKSNLTLDVEPIPTTRCGKSHASRGYKSLQILSKSLK